MYIPRHNASAEHKEWVLWIQKGNVDHDARLERLERGLNTSGKQTAVGASHTTVINNQTAANTETIANTRGLPAGGYRGSVVATDVDGLPHWSTPIGSIVPMYWVSLEEGGGAYDVREYGLFTTQDDAKRMLPAPYISGDGVSLSWPISWGDEDAGSDDPMLSDAMPLEVAVDVTPHSDGQGFEVYLPGASGRGATWSIVSIYNASPTYTADVTIVSASGNLGYAGVGTDVPGVISLAPGRAVVWRLDQSDGWGVARATPFAQGFAFDFPTDPRIVSVHLDEFYWANIVALREQQIIPAYGSLTVSNLTAVFNDRTDSVRIGKVRATVGTAPVGADIEIDVKLDGASILSTPLVIPAGDTTAVIVPDVSNFSASETGDAVVWLAGDPLTVEILQVGSPGTEGSNLNVQISYG